MKKLYLIILTKILRICQIKLKKTTNNFELNKLIK